MADASVKIESKGQGRSQVTLDMSDDLIVRVQEQVKEVTGDNMGLDFASFVNNALIEYIKSDGWARVKQYMIEENTDGNN